MDKVYIIGGGFSAAVCSMIFGEKATVISTNDLNRLGGLLIRRPQFEINKINAKNIKSYGSLCTSLTSINLHDRLANGGNSSIWGGFINIKNISDFLKMKLKNSGINFKKISFNETGSISNLETIYQLQLEDGEIFNADKYIKKYINSYVNTIKLNKEFIEIELLDEKSSNALKKIQATKIVLCVGVVQLIDLLYRSNLIKENDEISFTEFDCKYTLSFTKKIKKNNDLCLIKYKLGRALCHAVGIQKYNFLKKIDVLPIYIDQIFSNMHNEFSIKIENKNLTEIDGRVEQQKNKYGKSIHYCNMKINGEGINEFIYKFSPNIFGIGMPFVKQNSPGPISNDILNDIYNKLKND